jgi:hypothetical protein
MDYTPLLLIVAIPLIVVVQVYLMVLKMSAPENMMSPLAGGLTAYEEQIVASHREWLAYCNLQYLTSFKFGAIRVVVFQQQGTQRFFCFNFHQKLTYAIESRFDDISFFETGTSSTMGMFPARPNTYRQCYPDARADIAWQHHLEAEDYLMKKFGIVWRPLSQPYEQTLINSLRMWMKYIRSLPLWPFRALYWYAFKRGKIANKSAQMLYP